MDAFFKAQEAVQSKLPLAGRVLISVNKKDKDEVSFLAFVAGIPAAVIRLYVPSVATISKPSCARLLATSTTSSLSFLLTEISTLPARGSFDCTASCALKKASP